MQHNGVKLEKIDVSEELERRIKRSAAAQRVFNCPDGELVLKEIKAFCHGGGFIFDPNNPNPTTLAVNAGKRDALQFILNLLKDDPVKAREMLNAQSQTEGKTE